MIKVKGEGKVTIDPELNKFRTTAYLTVNYNRSYEIMLEANELQPYLQFKSLRKKSIIMFEGELTESRTEPGYPIIEVHKVKVIKR